MKKKIILLVSVITLFVSCKNTKKEEKIKNLKEVNQEQAEGVLNTQWINDIQLNNGNNWEANIETTEGVEKMQELLKSQTTTSIEDYHQLANKLNDIKNNVLKECTMKGASHDNLHVWLLPLIAKIDALSEAKTIEDAAKLKQSIEENINGYADYFK